MKKAKTVEQLIERGEIILLDPFMVRKAGLAVKVGLPKAEYEALEIDKALTEKKGKRVKALINAVMWLVFRCQKTGVKANAVVKLDAAGWPPMCMGVYPFNSGNESVLILGRIKEEPKKIEEFDDLLGETIASIEGCKENSDEILITLLNGRKFRMYHQQDCCEGVSVEDVCGDVADIVGSPLTLAEMSTSDKNPEGVVKKYQDSFTWTFYKLATVKGYMTIRWYGESNGYYSEKVCFEEVAK